jgi:UDP-glucose 4-epimerase
MRILLTGGSGDLGTILTADLLEGGHTPINIDLASPKIEGGEFVKGSITDREALGRATSGADMVVHIAAWHGIHEAQGTKTSDEFHDLNVTGTNNVLEAAADAGVKKFVFISSTSVDNEDSIYGQTKILGEEMVRDHAEHHDMQAIILRPRAFIPSWNRSVYNNFSEWGNWFMRGAVHVNDVEQAVMKSIDRLSTNYPLEENASALVVDGAYEYTEEDLKNWDKDGPGSTFKKYYSEDYEAAIKAGLNPEKKPKILDISKTRETIGYEPKYSLKSLLGELRQYGKEGPPAPYEVRTSIKGELGRASRLKER